MGACQREREGTAMTELRPASEVANTCFDFIDPQEQAEAVARVAPIITADRRALVDAIVEMLVGLYDAGESIDGIICRAVGADLIAQRFGGIK